MALTLKDIEDLERVRAACDAKFPLTDVDVPDEPPALHDAQDTPFAWFDCSADRDLAREALNALAKSAISPPDYNELVAACRASYEAQEAEPGGPFDKAMAGVKATLATLGPRVLSPPVPEDRAGLVERATAAIERLDNPERVLRERGEPWATKLANYIKANACVLRSAIALLSETRAGPGIEREGWRPIETAPKDGMPILGASSRGQCAVVAFHAPEWECLTMSGSPMGVGFYPTHWTPIPSPPRSEKP